MTKKILWLFLSLVAVEAGVVLFCDAFFGHPELSGSGFCGILLVMTGATMALKGPKP